MQRVNSLQTRNAQDAVHLKSRVNDLQEATQRQLVAKLAAYESTESLEYRFNEVSPSLRFAYRRGCECGFVTHCVSFYF